MYLTSMSKLLLVRHSQPDIDPARNAKLWNLSERGRELCIPLIEKLAPFNPNVIVSSKQQKAWETAKILAQYLKLPIKIEMGLHEHERGNEPFLDSPEEFQNKIRELFLHPHNLIYGAETASEALERYSTAIHKVVIEHPTQNIVIVSHGTVMSLFVAQHNPIETYEFWKNLKTPDLFVLSLPDFLLLS